MHRYKCWNPTCPRCGVYDYIIESEKELPKCPYCGRKSLERLSPESTKGARTFAGAAGGTLLGWAVGGPIGAVLGGIVGLIIGAESAEKRIKTK